MNSHNMNCANLHNPKNSFVQKILMNNQMDVCVSFIIQGWHVNFFEISHSHTKKTLK